MIFLGDVAHPFATAPDWSSLNEVLNGEPVVLNLEGALTSDIGLRSEPKLFNHVSVLDAMRKIGTRIVCLANNHITDIDQGAAITANRLQEEDMLPVGAGANLRNAAAPREFVRNGRTYIFVAFGWPTIQCVPAGDTNEGVNPLDPAHVIETISYLRRSGPDHVIIAMFHWNIELERYPQPAHRQLAFSVIESGANAVIGHHPHCVGGFEMYRDCPIAYSLGDWWIPHRVFFDGKLSFPDYTLPQIAFDWDIGRAPLLHWFEYERETHAISYRRSESLVSDSGPTEHTPFAGLSQKEYRKWFRRHRVKRKGLPIYSDFRATMRNDLRDRFIGGRHIMISLIRSFSGKAI